MQDLQTLRKLLKNEKSLDLALTHRSWVNEHPNIRTSNERLEFLGDAVLEFVVSENLFTNFPNKEEGFLTALRANLVNTINLAKIAKKLNLGPALFLSKGEEEGGGRENSSLLANTVEAIIGAVFIDSGLDAAKTFIESNILSDLKKIASEPLKDPKSALQEYVQAKGLPAPKYSVVEEEGPDHAKNFTIEVIIAGKSEGRGIGKNKGEAAQKAAQEALENFK